MMDMFNDFSERMYVEKKNYWIFRGKWYFRKILFMF